MRKVGLLHDEAQRACVARLLENAGLDERLMFGCPAFFLGRRMVACIYGNEVGIKSPTTRVGELLASGDAAPFRPYGKEMREWVALSQRGDDLKALSGLFHESIAFVRDSATR